MNKPRLAYYSDGHHFHAKRLDPPLSLHKMQWPVDELTGTGVDLLVFGLGYGDVYFHQTKIGRVVGQEKEVWESFIDWRIMRMVKDAAAMGTDQVREVIKRGRETGMMVFPSLKLQDPSKPGGDRCGRLKSKHGAEVCLGEPDDRFPSHGTEWAYDYTNELVRQEKMALIREILEDYEADGIELDFMFFPLYFRQHETEKGISIMNQFVAEVRAMANEVGDKQGRKIPIMARVWHRREDNLSFGLDPETWLKEGSVDLVAAQIPSKSMDTGNVEGRWLADAANAAGAAAYVQLRAPMIEDERARFPNIEMYRALSQTLQRQGFAGMYLGYLPWPLDQDEYQVLREMASPDGISRLDKRYFRPPRAKVPPYFAPDESPLPLDLEEGKMATVNIVVADDLESARRDGEMRQPVLTVTFRFFCVEDDVSIRFNGTAMPIDEAEIHEVSGGLLQRDGGTYWFRYRLEIDLLKRGENTVEITLDKATKSAGFARTVTWVEIHTRYKDFARPEGLDPEKIAPEY